MPDIEAGFDLGEFVSSSRLAVCHHDEEWASPLGERHTRPRLRTRELGGREPALRRAPRSLRPIARRCGSSPASTRWATRSRSKPASIRSPAASGRPGPGASARDGLLYILGIEADPQPLPATSDTGPTELHELVAVDHLTARRAVGRSRRPSTASCDRCRREALPLSVALVDLDRFKHYNDTFGHLAGDQCLVTVAKALQRRACP